jgi:hypothetical protein
MPGMRGSVRYEFGVCGWVPENGAETCPELDAVMLGGQTVSYGNVVDEARQFGLLARFRMLTHFRMLGLRVTEMRQLPS